MSDETERVARESRRIYEERLRESLEASHMNEFVAIEPISRTQRSGTRRGRLKRDYPKQVKATRDLLGMSQALFAQFLGVSVSLVQAWEQGQRKPEHMACRFLDEIRNDPDYWRERFLELAESKGETAGV